MRSHRQAVTILLVEDDDREAETIACTLKRAGMEHALLRAADGVQALEMLRAPDCAITKGPFILLVDVNMPRMNGLRFLQELRNDEKLRRSVVFILTRSTVENDKTAAYGFNIAGYLLKENLEEAVALLNCYARLINLPST